MQRRDSKQQITIVAEGVESFPENEITVAEALGREPLTAKELLEYHHERYHGFDKPGCILVKVRREMLGQEPNQHFLDIYGCLTCGIEKECLKSGWEIGWWGGKHVSELSSEVPKIPVHVDCENCGQHVDTTADRLNNEMRDMYYAHPQNSQCRELLPDKSYKYISWDFVS